MDLHNCCGGGAGIPNPNPRLAPNPRFVFYFFLKTKGAAGDFYLVYLHQKRFSGDFEHENIEIFACGAIPDGLNFRIEQLGAF